MGPHEPNEPSGTDGTLPVRRLTLYKHGVGFVEREGHFAGDQIRLVFKAPEVNDALKSLLVLDRQGGQVLGIEYETPADHAARLAEGPFNLSPDHTLLDLLRSLRGATVRLTLGAGTQQQVVEGRLLGIEIAEDASARWALVSIWDEATGGVVVHRLGDVQQVTLGEARVAQDVRHFLDTSRSEETRRTVRVRLDAGEHDLAVSYLIPSPTWRVSYRLVAESQREAARTAAQPETGRRPAGEAGDAGAGPATRQGTLLLQGWGLFDNRLEEDLKDVQVTLVAGQPISFVYDLATSHIPARPVVQDQARVAAAPVEFDRALQRSGRREMAAARMRAADGPQEMHMLAAMAAPAPQAYAAEISLDAVAQQAVAATGSDLGELFQYRVVAPVTVGRGESALVPILAAQIPYQRELLFNQQKLAEHPVAALRFTNQTGLVLERGPVTVLEDGAYRGEALVPFTKDGSEVYLAFLVELGIRVKVETATRLEIAGLRIERSFLWAKQARIIETTYLIANDLGSAEAVTVEHPIRQGYEVVDTRPPDAQTADWYRWVVPCPPRRATTFVVAQRTYQWQQHQVLDWSYDRLRQFLARRWLDAATLERLHALLQEHHTIARNTQEIGELQAEREQLYQREEHLRKNLEALRGTGEEATLRAQVFGQLRRSEERLDAIDARITALQEENKQRQAALDAALATLNVPDATAAASG